MIAKMRINEVNVRNQAKWFKSQKELYCNSLWIASDFLRLHPFNSFFSSLIYVGGGFFIRKGNHDDRSYYAPVISFFGSGKNIGIFFYCQSIGQDLQEKRIDEKEATEFAKEFFSSIFLRCSADEGTHFNSDGHSLMGQQFQWAGFESDKYILNNLYMLRYDTPSYHAYCRHTKDDEGDMWLYLVHFYRKDSQQETSHDPAS